MYRRVLQYYMGEEDAFDMRKAMPRDAQKRSIIPLGGEREGGGEREQVEQVDTTEFCVFHFVFFVF